MLRQKYSTLWLFSLIICTTLPIGAFGKDALQILPTRIVLDAQRSADLTLINKGDEAGTYRILLRNIRADDNGQFHEVQEAQPGEKFADKFISYSPRRVTVGAQSNQKVRLVVRKPKNLPDGEYRTHMVFQSLPEKVPDILGESDEVDVSVEPIIEISIPIIVRTGALSASIDLRNLSLTDAGNQLSLQLQREGSRSIYGDIEVFVTSGQAKGLQAGYVKGVSVYVPNQIRNFLLPLTLPQTFDKSRDQLLVRFKEDPAYGGVQLVEHTLAPPF